MRIVAYNILDGGVGRADPVAEVLEAQKADVIVLLEADDADVVTRIANRLRMDYVTGAGPKRSATVLSRWTIERSVNHALTLPHGPKSLLEVVIRTPAGSVVPVFAIHLSARAFEEDERRREAELEQLLAITSSLRDAAVPHVLAGDFNANAPGQRIDISKAKETTKKAYIANGKMIPRRVVARLLDAGYTDTLHAALGDYACQLASFTTHEPQQRVDYVFTHGLDLAAIGKGWIEQDRLATYASDHYPVGAEIDV